MIEKDNDYLWRQFIKLGDMMGNGLHHEPDGKWIIKEYNKLAKILIPEIKEQNKEKRKLKSEHINKQMQILLLTKKCHCGGQLEQSRSGSKVCYCKDCKSRYIAKNK